MIKSMALFNGAKFVDISFHPYRSMIISVASGVIAVWTKNSCQKYSALNPTSTHVDYNTNYQERESEFDENSDEDVEKHPKDPDRPIFIEELPPNFDPITKLDFSKKPIDILKD